MSSQAWQAQFHLKIWVELFHILLCFYHFYPDSTFMENDEETLKIKKYSSPWYCIDLWSSNLWKVNKFWQKETSFYEKISKTALEKNSLRREHILLTLFTNTNSYSCDTASRKVTVVILSAGQLQFLWCQLDNCSCDTASRTVTVVILPAGQ